MIWKTDVSSMDLDLRLSNKLGWNVSPQICLCYIKFVAAITQNRNLEENKNFPEHCILSAL